MAMMQEQVTEQRWPEPGGPLIMNDQAVRETDLDRLKTLLDQLQSSELQLGEAKVLRLELLNLVGVREADCHWV